MGKEDKEEVVRSGSFVAGDEAVYHMHAAAVADGLGVNLKQGIPSSEVEERRTKYGTNFMEPPRGKHPIVMFLLHLFSPIGALLYCVVLITGISKEFIDMTVVLLIIFGNAIIGFVQEYKSEMSLAALQKNSVGTATVMRDGTSVTVSINDVVVGDIVLLKMGDQLPADLRFFNTINIEVDEALLTGESVPIIKTIDPLPYPKQIDGLNIKVAIGDRTNMGYRQTVCTQGTGSGIVTAVGFDTQVGALSKRLSGASNQKTPLQALMEKFMYILFGVAIILALVIIGITGFTFDHDSVVYASATGIALLPEALIAVVSVTLALAVNRLAGHNAIVRKMGAVELLGSVTQICSDKTGTLTLGKMVVKRIWPSDSKYIFHVTGGALDATGGFGIEADENDPTNAATEELNRRASRATSRAMSRTSRFASRAQSDAARVRAPSYAHPVTKVVQGTKEADFTKVQAVSRDLALVMAMCNNTQLQIDEEDDQLVGTGNPTELALQVATFKLGLSPFYWEDEGYVKCGQWAFDSSAKCMSVGVIRESTNIDADQTAINTAKNSEKDYRNSEKDSDMIYRINNNSPTNASSTEDGKLHENTSTIESFILVKGAPEVMIPKCVGCDAQFIMKRVSHLASQGFRVLACAIGQGVALEDADGKRLHDFDRQEVEKDLRFVGLAVVFDPPRAESLDAVVLSKRAGVTFRMVTGDHHATAENIARRLQILEDHNGSDRVITGPVLDAMSEEQIDAMPHLPLVIARCSPESKVKMVEALHRRGEIVAMTGDGINDAPAIKIADVGAAMGIAGVDVTKNVSDIVLTDDNIATLVNAVEEGRNVALSIKKFVVHLLTSNIAEVFILMIGLAWNDSEGNVVFPLTPLEILWINMLTSTPPAIGLSVDDKDPDVMLRNPERPQLFTAEVLADQFIFGVIMGAIVLGSYLVVLFGFGDGDLGTQCNVKVIGNTTCNLVWRARTTVFATLNELLLIQGYVCRSPRKSMFSQSLISNNVLVGSFILGTLLVFPTVYIPWIAKNLFKHGEISWEWGIIAVNMVVYIICTEIYKAIKRGLLDNSKKSRTVITEDGGRIEMVPL